MYYYKDLIRVIRDRTGRMGRTWENGMVLQNLKHYLCIYGGGSQ